MQNAERRRKRPSKPVSEVIRRPGSCGEKIRLFGVPQNRLGLKSIDEFHQLEYERLRGELQNAYDASSLPEVPHGKPALHDLLLRLRRGT